MFVQKEEGKRFELAEGIHSKILGCGGNLMVVENRFDKGAVAPEHTHLHEQTVYVVSGSFEFSLKGEVRVLEAGDSLYAGPHDPHGCVCLEPGMVVDVFSPQRQDFLERTGGDRA